MAARSLLAEHEGRQKKRRSLALDPDRAHPARMSSLLNASMLMADLIGAGSTGAGFRREAGIGS
ncbi:MAG: hypothetical protein DRQ55_13770 [Planctomycetota bacterium]|nr:MAG: hypothetical protein DRQ55_13770 [Planctomycetota bacterium]